MATNYVISPVILFFLVELLKKKKGRGCVIRETSDDHNVSLTPFAGK